MGGRKQSHVIKLFHVSYTQFSAPKGLLGLLQLTNQGQFSYNPILITLIMKSITIHKCNTDNSGIWMTYHLHHWRTSTISWWNGRQCTKQLLKVPHQLLQMTY